MKKHVVVYKKLAEPLLARLRAECEVTYFEAIDAGNRAAFADAIRGAHGLLGASVRQLGLEGIDWGRIIAENVKPQYVELNQQAFELGKSLS